MARFPLRDQQRGTRPRGVHILLTYISNVELFVQHLDPIVGGNLYALG